MRENYFYLSERESDVLHEKCYQAIRLSAPEEAFLIYLTIAERTVP